MFLTKYYTNSSQESDTKGGDQGPKEGEVFLNTMKEKEKRKAQKEAARKCPRIFFGTRTHSQIAQLQKELLRTPYRPAMCILASRDHYCIHPRVSQSFYKNVEWYVTEIISTLPLLEYSLSLLCMHSKRLNDHGGCSFKHNKRSLINHQALQPGGELDIWDIEGAPILPDCVCVCVCCMVRQKSWLGP